MATAVIMPKQGQSVESCIIIEWKKQVGENVAEGDVLCDVETDKATLEVPSPVGGLLLATFFAAGDEVPVLMTIAAVGAAGEDVSALAPAGAPSAPAVSASAVPAASVPVEAAPLSSIAAGGSSVVSPRARALADRRGFDASALAGSGPAGRVIERDVLAALSAQPRLTPVAKAMVAEGGYAVPQQGSGPGGRVTSRDLLQSGATGVPAEPAPVAAPAQPVAEGEVTQIVLKGVRKIIAERMLASLQTTAQLTMNAYADARALQALRKRLKESPEALDLRAITINDLVLLAVSRSLLQHKDLNALFAENTISQYRSVHLGFAVDTPRGLVVPVIRNAHLRSLRDLAREAKRLSTAAIDGKSAPDDLQGGTFTVTNLGGFGVETFTPVLNPPQVAILGVGGINLRPVQVGAEVKFLPHIGLSLTINHQVVDGAPGARFLQTVAQNIAAIDLLLAG